MISLFKSETESLFNKGFPLFLEEKLSSDKIFDLFELSLRTKEFDKAQFIAEKQLKNGAEKDVWTLNLGRALLALGEAELAKEAFLRCIEISEKSGDTFFEIKVLSKMGDLYSFLGEYQKSIEYYKTAFEKSEMKNLEIAMDLANALYKNGQVEESMGFCLEVESLDNSWWEPKYLLAKIYLFYGKYDDSLQKLNEIKEIDKEILHKINILKIEIKMNSGKKFNRYEFYRSDKKYRDIYWEFLLSKKTGKIEKKIEYFIEECFNKKYAVRFRASLLCEIGKLLDQKKEWDKAFFCFDHAQYFLSKCDPWSLHEYRKYIAEKVSLSARIKNIPWENNSGLQPIFIIGLPRSGTSLLEQMLAQHSMVQPLGERPFFENFHIFLQNSNEKNFQGEFNRLAKKIVEDYKKISKKNIIIDKMPNNIEHIGHIVKIFPNAKFIFCKRNKADNGLSIFQNIFNGRHPYQHGLDSIREFIIEQDVNLSLYADFIHVGENFFYLQYEDLVLNQSESMEQIFSFLSLPIEDGYLDFYKDDRYVMTSSRNQVNKPLYSSSIGKWRNYEKYLKTLIEIS